METVALKAKVRDMAIAAKELRVEKLVPAECFGHNRENIHISVDHEQLRKAYLKAGTNTLIDLDIEGKNEKVLITDIQKHPVTDLFQHVDFFIVELKEKITTDIPLEYIGISNAVKNFAGILVTSMDEISVKCLPTDLVHSIQVDISKLENFGDSIHISDLAIPSGMEILDDPEMVLCSVQAPAEEEVDAPAADVSPANVPASEQKSEQADAK